MLLALDIGTSCGFAMLGDDDRVKSGTWDISVGRGQADGWRYAHLFTHLRKLEGVEAVAIEKTQWMQGSAIDVHAGISAIIKCWAAERGVKFFEVHNGTLKKFITGNGHAEKELVAEYVAKRFPGQIIKTTDQSDALGVLLWLVHQFHQGAPDADPQSSTRSALAQPLEREPQARGGKASAERIAAHRAAWRKRGGNRGPRGRASATGGAPVPSAQAHEGES